MNRKKRTAMMMLAVLLIVFITAGSCSDMMLQLDRVKLEVDDLIYLLDSNEEAIEGRVVDGSGDGVPDGIDITGDKKADVKLVKDDSANNHEMGMYAVDANGEVLHLQVNPYGSSSMASQSGQSSYLTTYTVQHFLQDVEGDGYTLDKTQKFLGASGTAAEAEPMDYPGFLKETDHLQWLSSGVIPSSGTLKLTCFYKRTLHEIVFVMNGGSPKIAPVNGIRYHAFLNPPKDPDREGFAFRGWRTETDGAGKLWDFEEHTIVEDTTLYASWNAESYTVTFNKEQGSGGTESVTVEFDAPMPDAEAPNRTGHTFLGYYSEPDGSGDKYYTGGMKSVMDWNIAEDTTLHAKWEANTYTVILDAGEGTGSTVSVDAVFDETMPNAAAPKRTGYTFRGYFTETDGKGIQYYNQSMDSVKGWDIAEDTTLYAEWEANTYTVTLDAGEGTGGTESVDTVFDQPMPADEVKTPERDGYAFIGFFTKTDGAGDRYYTSSMKSAKDWNIAEDTTLHAKWEANTYTVTFDAGEGTGGTESVDAVFDQPMPADGVKAPERDGYAFMGYYTKTDGAGDRYYTSSMESAKDWNIPGSKTLFAKWIFLESLAWNIDDTEITITSTDPSLDPNDCTFEVYAGYDNLNSTNPAEIQVSRTTYRVLIHPDYAVHGDLADILDDQEEFKVVIAEEDRDTTFVLPAIEMEEKEFAVTQEEAADDPEETDTFGSFRIDDYGTSSSTGNYWYRGYMFEVSQMTEVTHLISAVTDGGKATVVIYSAVKDGEIYKAEDLLGYVADVSGTGSEVETEIIAADGSETVSLKPGTTYLLAQTATDGQHVYVDNLDIDDLETHPRIKDNTWLPRTNNSIRWNGSGDQDFLQGKDYLDLHGAMPRIGLLFESDIETAVVETLEAERLTDDKLKFRGRLVSTGGEGNEVTLYFQYHTEKNVSDGTLQSVETVTSDGVEYEFDDFIFDPNETYYYRAYATNEGGKSFGDIWRAGATAMGTYTFGEWDLQVTGGSEATEYSIHFVGSRQPGTETDWESSTGTLTVRYQAGVSTLRDIEDAINGEAAAGLNALVPENRDNTVPPLFQYAQQQPR